MMLIIIPSIIIANILFLFFFWKKMKDDYIANQIFTSSFYILSGIVICGIVAIRFFPLWWFWSVFLGAALGMFLSVYRFRLRIAETIEAAVIALLPVLSIFFLTYSLLNNAVDELIYSLLIFALIIMFLLFDAHYKKFTWYKSGKIGFSGFTVMGLFFLLRALVAIFGRPMVSFLPEYDSYISLIIAFISFLSVFNLSRLKS